MKSTQETRGRRAAFVFIGALAGALAACGGEDSSGESPPPPPSGNDAGQSHDAGPSDATTLPPPVDSAPPEPAFDATGLRIVGTDLCTLTDDRRAIVLTIENTGSTKTFATDVRVSTDGGPIELRVKTPELDAHAKGTVNVDRGALVGFVADWKFTATIDPDGKHGAPHTPVKGECKEELRARVDAAMPPLAAFYNQDTGLYDKNDWWTSANQLETVIDEARETGDTRYFDEIDNTFTKNSSNNFDKFGFYDDDGWWGLTWVKAYDLTHQTKYLDMAKTIFDRMKGAWDTKCGGGIYWAGSKSDHPFTNKNAIPNELFLTLAARLHQRTPGDQGAGSYLDWAQKEWNWFKGTGMINADHRIVDGLNNLTDCKADGPIFTYNQGVILGGLTDLSASTGDKTLLDQAELIAHAAMTKMVDAQGILDDPPCGGDICVQFKGVLMRNLAYMAKARPSLDYQKFTRTQSDAIWNVARNAQSQFGYDWGSAFDNATAGRQSSAIDALLSAVRVSQMNMAIGVSATGSAPCNAAQGGANTVDGSSRLDSKWCSGGMTGQVLTLDLGAPRYIVGFNVRHAGAGGENSAWNTRDFEIATSADNAAWTTAVTVTGNTADTTSHPIPALTARYVRLHVTTAQTATDFVAARIYELEVLGVGY